MAKPLISVVIPTYNRAEYLRDCLNSIVGQFSDPAVYSQVEVVIADNASTDNTTEVVKEFQSKYNNIKYFKQAENVGFDKNFLTITAESTGDYCLSIGDDDAFFPGSFSVLIEKIKTLKLPYYMLNGWGYDHVLANPVLPYPNRQIKEDKIYPTLSEYVHSITRYTDLVGGLCGLTHLFERKAWQDAQNKGQYIGTYAIHMLVMMGIFKDRGFAILAEPVIKTRSSNIRWGVFPGLETMQGRISKTVKIAEWMRKTFNLNISSARLKSYFIIREYWFASKESVKKILAKCGLDVITRLYRKMR